MLRNNRTDNLHQSILELAAASGVERLSPKEETLVLEHLATCSACAQAARELRLITDYGRALPKLIHGGDSLEALWDPQKQKQRLLARVHSQDEAKAAGWAAAWRQLPPWRTVQWAAAAVVILAASTIVGYHAGNRAATPERSNVATSSANLAQNAADQTDLLRAKSVAETERVRAEERARAAEQRIPVLESEIAKLDSARLELLSKNQELSTQVENGERALLLASSQRNEVADKLAQNEKLLRTVQQELSGLREQRSRDLLRAANAEFRLQQISTELRGKDQTIARQQQLLESDNDIRELMGARQLHIADIVDVDKDGRNRKPFGRVFYTKGKSLLFYAFDLDQQPGTREASVFQAWGHSDSSSKSAVSLGIFYLDNETNHRWIVKTDNAELLSKLDAVFVTVEKNGNSKKPTGKPFLYTYLRKGAPNHP